MDQKVAKEFFHIQFAFRILHDNFGTRFIPNHFITVWLSSGDGLAKADRCLIHKAYALRGRISFVLIDRQHNVDIQTPLTRLHIHIRLGRSDPAGSMGV